MLSKFFLIGFLCLIFFSCTKQKPGNENAKLEGTISVDGSSTVYPITEAVAEEFNKIYPKTQVTVGFSGTGGGFKKFLKGETDINDASRPIKSTEAKEAKLKVIEYFEIPVAYDGITIVVNPKNTWVNSLTTQELNKIWKPGSNVQTWKDIRSSWPNRPIKLYGPGTDSGTFDYFTEAINGKSQVCRSEFTKSEDDNVLVLGVSGDLDALGFFGFAYYKENMNELKAVAIDSGKGKILPTLETIKNGTYAPLSRPLFIYVSRKSLLRKEVKTFIEFYLNNATELVKQVGYVPLPLEEYKKIMSSMLINIQDK